MMPCPACANANPAGARYCMQCGRALPEITAAPPEAAARGGIAWLVLSLGASLLLSFVLIYVFHLPIFFLAGFLPLFWWRRRGQPPPSSH